MRLRILAIGRFKNRPESLLIEEYQKRLRSSLAIEELEVKQRSKDAALQKAKEATLFRQALSEKPAGRRIVIVLDERGTAWSSIELAQRLAACRKESIAEVVFVIGGADGLDPDFVAEADAKLSLGKMTWPHALARVMLVEQIYRALQILENHPYHRA